jgi:glycosyltransferase involved in cell wall biosynthesis
MVAALGREFCFRIVTLDRDLGEKSRFPGTLANRWVRVGDAEVMYLGPELQGFLGMYALLRSVDMNTILYVNSFFSRRFSMLAVFMCWLKLCRPRCLVLAPRGEFSPGALRFKPTRKRLFIRISHCLGLHRDIIWHASSHFEEEAIRRQFPRVKYIDIADVVPGSSASGAKKDFGLLTTASDFAGRAAPVRRELRPKVPGQLRAVFVGRCTRMKNLLGALGMLRGVSGDVSFDIYGPKEDGEYWEECQGLIATLPPNIRVKYWGEIQHERVSLVFQEHDLLLFPTLGEGYCHVIAEALLAGCPVVASDQTPWRGLETLGVGWDLPLSAPDRFREALQHCVEMGPKAHAAMCERAFDFGASLANDPAVIERTRALFRLAFSMPAQVDATSAWIC